MNLIFQIIIIAYLFFLVPFHMGILEAVFFSKYHKKMSEIFVNGYLLMLACFSVLSIAAVRVEWSLSRLTVVWVGFVAAISIMANVFGQKQMKEFIWAMMEFWEIRGQKSNRVKGRYRLFLVLALFVIGSIFFTRPKAEDRTWEIVHTAISTDTMYAYDEYSGYLSEDVPEGHAYAPIEMLYAAGACLTGISETVLLYYIVPVCLIFFFYMVLWQLGTQFFKESAHIETFVWIVSVLYWMTVYLEGQSVVTGIFLNSWNGLTLLSCCIMPAALSSGLCVIRSEVKGQKRTSGRLEKIYQMVILVLAGQLTNEKGGFYILLMLGIMLAVIIAGKGYCYGVTTGRFKKCV